jgi:hypothetical protein
MNQLLVQVDEGGLRHVGWRGKVQLKCGDGRKLLWGAHLVRRVRNLWEGRALCENGAPLVRRARPYCLFDRQGAQAPIDYLINRQGAQAPSGGVVISSSSLMQLRVHENQICSW